jgi:N6-adenosine-specific RNA methylase IME4
VRTEAHRKREIASARGAQVTRTLATADIKIGKRHRKDMGDLDGLAASIADIGLLHPVVVRPDGRLIAGERRLRACKQLGWQRVPATIVDLDEVVRGEFHENTLRKDLLPSEIFAIGSVIEKIERERAKARMSEGARCGNLATPSEAGRSRDKAAAFAGVSGRHYDKIAAIVAAAEAEPEKFGRILADMDRTGRVNGPFKRLKVIRQAAAIRAEPPPYPNNGPYRVAAIDVPWPYDKRKDDPSQRGVTPYVQMSIAEILAERDKVLAIMHADCILWFWTTNHHMGEAFAVLAAWGFQQKTILTWVKDKMGTGDWLRGQSEHCLMAVRGNPIVELTNQTTILHGKVREHSRKPAEFYPFAERLCPAPRYASLFAREPRDRWDCHGDEVGLFAAAPASASTMNGVGK